jgi:hypothetical protein
MKSIALVIAIAVLGVTGVCRADDVGPGQSLKAVLHEEDPANPSGVQYVGSVMWRTEARWRAMPGAGQKPYVGVLAYIEIPERKMSVSLWLRRNDDKQLPASHVIEVTFTLPADFVHGGIANVPGLLMKAGETAPGDALRGVSVKVATNFFLIGLSDVEEDRQRNTQLMKERQWLDVPIVYSDGRRAILTIEGSEFGDRAVMLEPPKPIVSGQPGTLKPWPVASATPAVLRPVVQPSVQMSLPVLERPDMVVAAAGVGTVGSYAWPAGDVMDVAGLVVCIIWVASACVARSIGGAEPAVVAGGRMDGDGSQCGVVMAADSQA